VEKKANRLQPTSVRHQLEVLQANFHQSLKGNAVHLVLRSLSNGNESADSALWDELGAARYREE